MSMNTPSKAAPPTKNDTMMAFQQFQNDVRSWSVATFGPEEERIQGMIAHLRREVNELEEHPQQLSELADCFILLVNIAGAVGYDMHDLLAGSQKKMLINKERKWREVLEDLGLQQRQNDNKIKGGSK